MKVMFRKSKIILVWGNFSKKWKHSEGIKLKMYSL